MAPRCGPLLIALLVLTSAADVRAGGLSLDLLSPRGVGRAGAGVVSDDGAAAVVVNPAALARRDGLRVQAALVVTDDAATFAAPGVGVQAEERGASTLHPVLGAQLRLGPVVVGAALLDQARWSRRFAAPASGTPPADVERLYPHRYAGTSLAHRRRTLGVAAAWRATEWLALGAAATASRVTLDEARRLWAGFSGRDRVGDAARDVDLAVTGVDALVLGGVIGALIAPIDVPIELAASVAWAQRARLKGDATARPARPGQFPAVQDDGAVATVEVAAPLVVRTGVRWLGERWIVELAGELWRYPRGAVSPWSIAGVTVTDDTGATAALRTLPSRAAPRDHGALRGALDVEAIAGLVWLTAGYAHATAGTAGPRLTGVGGDLGGHTAAFGAEITAEGFTVTIGLAHTFARAVDVTQTTTWLDNPFDAGSAPAALGRLDQGRDQIAVTVEAEWP